MKNLFARIAKKANLLVRHNSTIGIDVENDICRLRNSIETVFDVGANHGQTAIRFTKAFPGAIIHSFEPVKSNYKVLKKKTCRFSNILPVMVGLNSHPGRARVGLSENPGGHSLKLATVSKKVEMINLNTVDNYCLENNINFIDLLKIDVEGLELNVLKGSKILLDSRRIAFIYAECILSADNYAPHTLFDDLRDYLNDYGFCVFAFYHEAFNLKTGSALANVLFANKDFLPRVANGKLKNLYYPDDDGRFL